MSSQLIESFRIDDPAFYADDPYPVFAALRAESPVHPVPELKTYAISRWADIRQISRSPELFCSSQGFHLNDAKYGNSSEGFFPEGAELILLTDPPRHRELRKTISPTFAAPAIQRLEPFIREHARAAVADIVAGQELDFVEDVAVALPIRVVTALLGLDDASIPDVRRWSDLMSNIGGDLSKEELEAIGASVEPLFAYVMGKIEQKRTSVGDDLISTLIAAAAQDDRLNDLNVAMLTTATLVAGNSTTRNLLSCCVAELARHPDQLAKLVADPTLIPGAVDEVLRFVSPVAGFMRTAVEDTVLHDQVIKAGEHVYLMYASANWDETVFPDPGTFDITRPSHPTHVAFGYGEHVCPGASLARLEATVLLSELVKRFSSWQVTGTPSELYTILENGYTSLPMTFTASA